MDENYETLDLKSKLIIAGIDELNAHGVEDFSIRRVASNCGVSCAAPYRHYKSKDDLILEIIRYIGSKWELLQSQIEEVYGDDIPTLVTELSAALIRFNIANPQFRAVITINRLNLDAEQQNQIAHMTDKIMGYIKEYFMPMGEETAEKKGFIFSSMIYGAILLCDSGSFDDREKGLKMVKECMKKEFE